MKNFVHCYRLTQFMHTLEIDMRSFLLCLATGAALAPALCAAQNDTSQLIRACDLVAASPFDPWRPADIIGVAPEKLDAKLAYEPCKQALAAAPDNPRLQFEVGRILHVLKDFVDARSLYERAAAQGYGSAQGNLAVMYQSGQGGLAR